MKLEDQLQRMRDLAPATGLSLGDVEHVRASRHRSRRVAAITLAIIVSLGGTSLLVSSFDRGNDGNTPAIQAIDAITAHVSLDRTDTSPTATLSYGEAVREGVPVQVIGQGQRVTGFSEPARVITDFLGSSDFSIDLGALDPIAPDSITMPADVRIESESEDLLLLLFAKSDTGTDLMTPLLAPTDLKTLDPGRYLMVIVGRSDSETPHQFAFAVDVAATAGPAEGGTYVFSDVVAGPSRAEPEDLAVTFTVDWPSDGYPGIHICRFLAFAEDGAIVGEFVEYSEWDPGRDYQDVPGDPNAVVTGEVRCQADRLDAPGIADVTPIPHNADTPIDEIVAERQERLSAWALQFDVDGMSDTALAANVLAVWRAVGDGQETTEVMQLTDRFNYLCGRVPSDREMLRDYCD